jgi:hypothetical protein
MLTSIPSQRRETDKQQAKLTPCPIKACEGTPFFMPRVAAVAALAFVALFFVLRFCDPFHVTMSVDSFVVIASIVPIVVSIVGLFWHDSSV